MAERNENCLEGMRCPKCKSFGPFWIAAEVTVLVNDDGIQEDGDHHWDEGSFTRCFECDHYGKKAEFAEKEPTDA